MNNYYIHLTLWQKLLTRLLRELLNDNNNLKSESYRGQYYRYWRQLNAVTDVLCAAPYNIDLYNFFNDIYNNEEQNNENRPIAGDEQEHFYQAIFQNDSAGKNAVNKALSALKDNDIFIIHGPPGTGKTSVIAEVILQLLHQDNNLRIAITSETHIAVDNALEEITKYLNHIEHQFKIIRYPKTSSLGLSDYSFNSYLQIYQNTLDEFDLSLRRELFRVLELDPIDNFDMENVEDEANQRKKYIHKIICENINILGITCNHLGRFNFEIDDVAWDYVFIDEVSKATLPEIFIASQNAKKLILIGDPQQLPPSFCNEEIEIANEIGIEEKIDVMEQLLQNSLVDKLYSNINKSQIVFLDTQYRMTDEIGNLISKHFYPGKGLINGRNKSIQDSIKWLDYSASKLKVPSFYKQGKPVLENKIECNIILDELQRIQEKIGKDTTVAIITPYVAQKILLEKQFKARKNDFNFIQPDNLEINTIDAFQGKQAKIVFFCTVRNFGSQRFFSNSKRLNVAISRAEDYLYIVGASSYLSNIRIFAEILNDVRQKGNYFINKVS